MSLNTPNNPPESDSRRSFLRFGLGSVAALTLHACGGGGSSLETVDKTPPKVDTFSVKNGSALTANPDASYSVSGNLGTTQEYTLSFSEKLGAAEYTVQMLDANNAPVALPAGVTATLVANDASRLSYTLTIVTNAGVVFDAGQASKTLKLQSTVADVAGNRTPVNVTETVNDVAPVAGGAFASLTDMTVSDNSGNPAIGGGPSIIINAGGVNDSLGRTTVYSQTGLPTGITIDSSTGVISGVYDSNAIYGQSENFPVTITATPQGSTKNITKSFILSIRNDG